MHDVTYILVMNAFEKIVIEIGNFNLCEKCIKAKFTSHRLFFNCQPAL